MASRLTEHKLLLWQLYIEKNLTAKQIAKYMHEERQLKCNEGVYQRAFRKWGFKKNCDGSDWFWVDKKQRGRQALGKETRFTFNDQIMDGAKIQKEISRNVSTAQQKSTATTPGTPSGWAAITPTASTPGYEPSGSHILRSESPVEQEANADTLSAAYSLDHGPAIDTKPEQLSILSQTMRECGIFIEMCARAHLTINKSAMASMYYDVASSIVFAHSCVTLSIHLAVARSGSCPKSALVLFDSIGSAYHILRLTFFDDHSRLDQFLRKTERTPADVLRTALFLTCKGNQHQAARVLLSYGAAPNSRDTNGDPCLVVASRNKLDKMVELLLDVGANIEAKDRAGETAWSHVCGLQSHELVASILEKAGAEKNVRRYDGYSALHMASGHGHMNQVRVMLNRGMDPSFAAGHQWQPLHWAVHNGRVHIVKILIEAGADLNPISVYNTTPLDLVSNKGDTTDIRQLLISHGAQKASQMRQKDMSGPYSFGSTPNSSFESNDSEYLQSTADTQGNLIPAGPPTLTSSIQMQTSFQVSDISADSFDVSRGTATMSFPFSTRQDTTLHIAASSTSHANTEEPPSSPYLYSRLVWPSESPTPFHSGQSPQPRRMSIPKTPTLASFSNTEPQIWASPQMPESIF